MHNNMVYPGGLASQAFPSQPTSPRPPDFTSPAYAQSDEKKQAPADSLFQSAAANIQFPAAGYPSTPGCSPYGHLPMAAPYPLPLYAAAAMVSVTDRAYW